MARKKKPVEERLDLPPSVKKVIKKKRKEEKQPEPVVVERGKRVRGRVKTIKQVQKESEKRRQKQQAELIASGLITAEELKAGKRIVLPSGELLKLGTSQAEFQRHLSAIKATQVQPKPTPKPTRQELSTSKFERMVKTPFSEEFAKPKIIPPEKVIGEVKVSRRGETMIREVSAGVPIDRTSFVGPTQIPKEELSKELSLQIRAAIPKKRVTVTKEFKGVTPFSPTVGEKDIELIKKAIPKPVKEVALGLGGALLLQAGKELKENVILPSFRASAAFRAAEFGATKQLRESGQLELGGIIKGTPQRIKEAPTLVGATAFFSLPGTVQKVLFLGMGTQVAEEIGRKPSFRKLGEALFFAAPFVAHKVVPIITREAGRTLRAAEKVLIKAEKEQASFIRGEPGEPIELGGKGFRVVKDEPPEFGILDVIPIIFGGLPSKFRKRLRRQQTRGQKAKTEAAQRKQPTVFRDFDLTVVKKQLPTVRESFIGLIERDIAVKKKVPTVGRFEKKELVMIPVGEKLIPVEIPKKQRLKTVEEFRKVQDPITIAERDIKRTLLTVDEKKIGRFKVFVKDKKTKNVLLERIDTQTRPKERIMGFEVEKIRKELGGEGKTLLQEQLSFIREVKRIRETEKTPREVAQFFGRTQPRKRPTELMLEQLDRPRRKGERIPQVFQDLGIRQTRAGFRPGISRRIEEGRTLEEIFGRGKRKRKLAEDVIFTEQYATGETPMLNLPALLGKRGLAPIKLPGPPSVRPDIKTDVFVKGTTGTRVNIFTETKAGIKPTIKPDIKLGQRLLGGERTRVRQPTRTGQRIFPVIKPAILTTAAIDIGMDTAQQLRQAQQQITRPVPTIVAITSEPQITEFQKPTGPSPFKILRPVGDVPLQRIIPRPKPRKDKPPPETPPPEIILGSKARPRRRIPIAQSKKVQGYNVLVKRAIGKGFTKANPRAVTRAQAINLGARVTDIYVNRSFTIRKAAKKVPPSPERVSQGLLRKFRTAKGRPSIFVEKSRHAIDSFQEKQGIPFKAARLRRRGLI